MRLWGAILSLSDDFAYAALSNTIGGGVLVTEGHWVGVGLWIRKIVVHLRNIEGNGRHIEVFEWPL